MSNSENNGVTVPQGSLGRLGAASLRALEWLTLPLAWLSLILVRGYQRLLSPMLVPSCRFTPSCSEYAAICLQRHSLPRAYWLIAGRLLRCHPWGGQGYDPVPERASSSGGLGEGAHVCLKCSHAASSVIPSPTKREEDRCVQGEAPPKVGPGPSDVGSAPL